MKCFPSGRNSAQRWLDSKRDLSSLLISTGEPPRAETRNNGPNASGDNTITPSRFQAPPRPLGASHTPCDCPPAMSIFLSLPSAKNPIDLLSGDQNGYDAPCVPSNAVLRRPPTS